MESCVRGSLGPHRGTSAVRPSGSFGDGFNDLITLLESLATQQHELVASQHSFTESVTRYQEKFTVLLRSVVREIEMLKNKVDGLSGTLQEMSGVVQLYSLGRRRHCKCNAKELKDLRDDEVKKHIKGANMLVTFADMTSQAIIMSFVESLTQYRFLYQHVVTELVSLNFRDYAVKTSPFSLLFSLLQDRQYDWTDGSTLLWKLSSYSLSVSIRRAVKLYGRVPVGRDAAARQNVARESAVDTRSAEASETAERRGYLPWLRYFEHFATNDKSIGEFMRSAKLQNESGVNEKQKTGKRRSSKNFDDVDSVSLSGVADKKGCGPRSTASSQPEENITRTEVLTMFCSHWKTLLQNGRGRLRISMMKSFVFLFDLMRKHGGLGNLSDMGISFDFGDDDEVKKLLLSTRVPFHDDEAKKAEIDEVSRFGRNRERRKRIRMNFGGRK